MKILATTDKTTLLSITLILLAGLVPLTWYHPAHTIIWGDNSPFWFNTPQTLPYQLNMWMSSDGLGHISTYPPSAPLLIPMYVLQLIGLSNGVIQAIIFSILLICSGLTMYYFLSTLIGKKPLALFVGSLFYMFCIFFMLAVFNLVINWAHAFVPLILSLFVNLIKQRTKKQPSGKVTIAFLLSCSLLLPFLTVNPPILAIALLSLFIVFLYAALTNPVRKVIRESFKVTAQAILVSLWWIIPFALASLQVIIAPGQSLAPRSNFTDYRGSIFNALWFNPVWAWTGEYYPYINYYSNPLVILATFIPIIIAAIGLLFKQGNKKMQYLLFCAILLTILIERGSHPPLEQINAFLNAHIPMFGTLFREPENKFAIIVALFTAPLVACSTDSIVNAIKKYSNKFGIIARRITPIILVAIISLSIIISAGPMFLGQIGESKTDLIPYSSYVEVPAYWNQVGEFLSNDSSDFRVLIAPDDPYQYIAYDWGYWGVDSLPNCYIQKPVLFNTYGYQTKTGNMVLNMTYQAIENRSYSTFSKLLTLQNIKYIVLRNDLVWNFSTLQAVNPSILINHLGNDSDLEYIKSIGQLDIYRYKNWVPAHFVSSPNIFGDNLSSLLSQSSLANNPVVEVNATQISPSQYKVHINATQPFYLFFKESYDSEWKLAEGNSDWYLYPFSKDISENHTSAYDFGNMWYITKTGSYDLNVYYAPESYFLYGISISLLSLSLIMAYIGFHHYKSRKSIP